MCQCDDGYAARGAECIAVREPARAWSNRRAAWAGPRVVDVAFAQVGRGPREVGAGLDGYPGPMRRFIARGEMWCTDFVAWVYLVAGVPFTGGYQGGWHVGNNFALKEWFRRHSAWVQRGTPEWRTYEPQPGDYVRLHTQSGAGHSAIVRRLDGDTLYTIEGNVGNVVRLRRYRNFRDDRRMDGIGRLVPRPPTSVARR